MPPKINVVRPDGTRLSVSPEQAAKLELLGYKKEETNAELSRSVESGKEDYYQGQALQAGVEGLFRGASLGITDYLRDDPEVAARAKYNPGVATATEIAGAIAPELIPGVGAIAPSALVGRGARAVIPGTGLAAKATRGAVEGGVFGGAMAADHAYLAGDPITAEAVLHGVGWGSLFGGGLAAAGSRLTARGESNFARGLAQEAKAAETIAAAKVVSPGAFESVAAPTFAGVKAEAKRLATDIAEATKTTEAILSGNKKAMAKLGLERTVSEEFMGRAQAEMDSAFKQVSAAMSKKKFNPEALQEKIAAYEDTVAKLATKAGMSSTGSGGQALMELAQMKLLQKELGRFPESATAFAKMNERRAEALFASVGAAKKLSNWPALGKSLEDSANKLQEALGIAPTGTDGLRAAWNIAKKQVKAEKVASRALPEVSAEPGLVKKGVAAAAGFAGYKVASMTGHPLFALGVGSKVRNAVLDFGATKTPALVAARNQSLGRIKQAVGNFQIKAGNVVSKTAPKVSPLTIKLDGTQDTSTKDVSQLAYNRISEFSAAAFSVKDTLFRGLEPILVEQPELGPAIHQAGVAAFQAIRGMLPADPGVVSGLKPIWKPSRLQAEVMSRQLSVFQDPVGTAEEMLASGIYDPIRVKALKAVAPQTFSQLQIEMLGRIQEPGFLDNMYYKDQVALGALLDIPIHSSMRPEYIAASLQLHTNRNQPLPTPAAPGNTNGGRPAGDTPGATAGQIATSR